MLCHVCKRAAVGQCRHCSRFYCAEHGRNGQVQWAQQSPNLSQTITLQEIALPTQLDLLLNDPDALSKEAFLANPLRETECYCCNSTALCSCNRCGRLGCAKHVTRSDFWRDDRLYCQECRHARGTLMWGLALTLVLAWAGALLVWVLIA